MCMQRDGLSIACFSAFCFCVLATTAWFDFGDVTIDYILYFAVYSTLCYYSILKDNMKVAIAALLIAFYDLIFSLDSFANYDTETYIWRHHEVFVIVLHALLMCVLSKKFNSILCSSWHNIRMLFSTRVFSRISHEGCGRQKG